MKKIITLSMAFATMIITSSLCYSQANTSLSNLASSTAVNADLIPNKNNKLNLGSSSKSWRRLYLSDGIYSDSTRIFVADTTNTSAGYNSLVVNTGKYNTAVGTAALRSNGPGVLNTALGASALLYNISGSGNTAAGTSALYVNTTGSFNTASGYLALGLNKTGSDNTAIGNNALYSNTTGYSNVAIGTHALYKSTNQYGLVAVGDSALFSNTTGSENIAIGWMAAQDNTSGSGNAALGAVALNFNKSGSSNTAIGNEAMQWNSTGNQNTAIGYAALYDNTQGNYNTATGYLTMYNNITGNYNSVFGYAADVHFDNLVNATAIGAFASVDANNKVRIGSTSVTSIGGQVGWTTFSDGRYKKNIKENVPGLDFINALRPVTYTVDINGLNTYFKNGSHNDSLKTAQENSKKDVLKDSYDKASKIIQTGFIAQEVETAANKLGYDFNGVDKPEDKSKLYGLRYDEFVVPLVKAVQELSKENDDIKKENEELKSRLDKIETMLAGTQQTSSTGDQQIINTIQPAGLGQNQPNPTSSTTIIKYFIPQQTSKAVIKITNTNGEEIKSITLTTKNNGQVTLQANELTAGTYFYSLIVDGKIIDTKKMVIAH